MLCCQRCCSLHHWQQDPWLRHVLGRLEPLLHDRGNSACMSLERLQRIDTSFVRSSPPYPSLRICISLLPPLLIFQGIRHSKCEKRVFRHNDMKHLEELLVCTDRSERDYLGVFRSLGLHIVIVCFSSTTTRPPRCLLSFRQHISYFFPSLPHLSTLETIRQEHSQNCRL